MTHPEMDELYELYVLGAVDPEQAAEIDQHVRDECPYCREHIGQALTTAAAMSGLAEQKTPPARLRQRVLAGIAPRAQASYPWLLVIGLSAACIALVGFAIWAGVRIISMGDRIDALTTQRDQLRAAVVFLSKPETQKIGFAGAVNAPHGRVFLNRTGFVFVGSQMPGLPPNSTFELWLIPASGAPQPAGLFRSNAEGDSVHVTAQQVNIAQMKAVAVSVEPRRGSPAPTTKPFLVLPLG
jgi:anti-sigma-K factor RskA